MGIGRAVASITALLAVVGCTAVSTPSSEPASTTTLSDPTTSSTAAGPVTTVPVFDAVVRPGESIQEVVDRLGAGSKILIATGVHVRQQVIPKGGMSFVGEPGAVLDGENATEYAFYAFVEDSDANDVTIRGLEIRNYSPSNPSLAAITAHQVSGWRVEDCDIHDNAYVGVYVGRESVVRGNNLHHNGSLGLAVTGDGGVAEENEIHHNNPEDVADPLWEAGGIKFGGGSSGIVIRDNHVHDNHGPGVWADEGATQSLIEDNLIENNHYAGIDYEISSHAVIRNNTVRNNGHQHPGGWFWGAGITIRGPHVEVYGNTVEGNYNGIVLIQTTRDDDGSGPVELMDIEVTDNLIVNSGRNGAVSTSRTALLFDTSSFEGNRYQYEQVGRIWEWAGRAMGWTTWQRAGNDLEGELDRG